VKRHSRPGIFLLEGRSPPSPPRIDATGSGKLNLDLKKQTVELVWTLALYAALQLNNLHSDWGPFWVQKDAVLYRTYYPLIYCLRFLS